jgi:AcrR family transcriptional regulator
MKKNKEERTEEILDLCLNCWKDLSPTQWSLTPVAQACGISKQALYRYFPNKQAILTALKDRYEIKTKTNRSDIYTLAEQQPPQWKAICRLSYEFMYENWDLLLMVMHHGLGDPLETLIELQTFYNNLEKKSSFSKAHWGWFFNGLISFMWQRNPQSYEEMEKFMEKVTKGLAPGVTLSSEVIEQININPLGKIKIEINDNPIDGALLDLMHREGRSDHSMQELAQEAGMGKSSIYIYYSS